MDESNVLNATEVKTETYEEPVDISEAAENTETPIEECAVSDSSPAIDANDKNGEDDLTFNAAGKEDIIASEPESEKEIEKEAEIKAEVKAESEAEKVKEDEQKGSFYTSAKVFGISEGQMEDEFKSYKAGKLFEKISLILTDPYLPIEAFKNKLLSAMSMGLSSVSVLPNRLKIALKAVNDGIPVYVCVGFPYAIEGATSLSFSLKKVARTKARGVEMPLNLADLNEKKLKTIISEYKKYRNYVKKKDFVLIADISRMSPTDLGALAKICKEAGIKTVRTSCAERATKVDEYLLNNLKANLGEGIKVVACSTEDGNREVIGIFACGADKFASPQAIDIARGIKTSLEDKEL